MPAEEREPVPGASRRALMLSAMALPLATGAAPLTANPLPPSVLMARYLAWLEREAAAVRSLDEWGGLLLHGFHVHDLAVAGRPAADHNVAAKVLQAAGVAIDGGVVLPSLVQGGRVPASVADRRVALWERRSEHFWRRADDPAFDERDTHRLVLIAHRYDQRVLDAPTANMSVAAAKLRVFARVADQELADDRAAALRDLATFIGTRV